MFPAHAANELVSTRAATTIARLLFDTSYLLVLCDRQHHACRLTEGTIVPLVWKYRLAIALIAVGYSARLRLHTDARQGEYFDPQKFVEEGFLLGRPRAR